MNIATTATIVSGLLLFMGVFEAWTEQAYNFDTFIFIIALVLSISILANFLFYQFSIAVVTVRSLRNSVKYFLIIKLHYLLMVISDGVGLENTYNSDLSIIDQLVLESTSNRSLQTIDEISIDVGYDHKTVKQNVENLCELGFLTEGKIDQYTLTRKGYAALRKWTSDET